MSSKSSSIRRWLILGSIVTFAFALCVVGARTQSGETKTVTITAGPPPSVSPDPVNISKTAGDVVAWKCYCTWQVHFAHGSPFASDTFDNSHAQSGPVRSDAAKGLYHYAVTVNGHTTDPGVQVNP